MGLEIMEEFRPITPIRTTRTFKRSNTATELSHPEITTKELNDNEECHTPTSAAQTLRTPLVCPPAPKKPRVAPERNHLAPPPSLSQGFFQVPHDLASVFLVHAKPFKKQIRTSS